MTRLLDLIASRSAFCPHPSSAAPCNHLRESPVRGHHPASAASRQQQMTKREHAMQSRRSAASLCSMRRNEDACRSRRPRNEMEIEMATATALKPSVPKQLPAPNSDFYEFADAARRGTGDREEGARLHGDESPAHHQQVLGRGLVSVRAAPVVQGVGHRRTRH